MRVDNSQIQDMPEELKAFVADMQERYELRIEYLEERIRVLQQAIFGKKSEKRRPAEGDGEYRQLRLFNEAEVLVEEKKQTESVIVPEHTRKKPKRKPLPADLPRVEVIHDIPEEEKVCACGAPLCRIGEEVNEKLDIIPAKIRVIRNIRPKYACKSCEGVESKGPSVLIAPNPVQIIPKGIATPGLLSHIIVSKYIDALPLYRQEKIFLRQGIELSRSTMSGWIMEVAHQADPLMALLRKELLCGPLINADETRVQVLDEPGRANTTQSYMWVFRGGSPDKPVVIFRYSETRSSEVPLEMLEGFTGYLQTDAFSAYEVVEKRLPGIILVGCFAHTRRYFVKVVDARPKSAKTKTGSAELALQFIGNLYAIEAFARKNELGADQIKSLRAEKAVPVLDEFKDWLDKRVSQTPPKGLLGQALQYAQNHWPKLIRYLEDGHIPIDNNIVENDIRPFAVGRRNWLFCGHPNGANASATLHSLITTARACRLDPYQYLRFLFEKLPYARSEEDFRALLPQNITAEQLARFMASV